MTNPILEAKARAQAAIEDWRDARRAVNNLTSIPARLDALVSVAERTIATIDQDIVTEVEAIVVELSALQFSIDIDESLGALERATLALDGALGRIARAASRAGFADVDDDLGLPPGVRIPVTEISSQLEAFIAALDGVKPVLDKIAKAQADDLTSNAKQNALVQSVIDKASVKIEIIDVKTHDISRLDVTGLAAVAQQLKTLLQSFVATIVEAGEQVSLWLSRDVPKWMDSAITSIGDGAIRLLRRAATWIQKQAAIENPNILAPEEKSEVQLPVAFDLVEVENMIRRGEIPPAEAVPFVTSLSIQHLDQKAMAVLGRMTGLRRLVIQRMDNMDLSPIGELVALQALSIYGMKEKEFDLSPLARLTNLLSLSLTGMRTRDLQPLANLRTLTSLSLAGTRVVDISALAGLTQLRSLVMAGGAFKDLSPLADMTALVSLHISGGRISDLSPLAHLKALKLLSVTGSRIRDISPLAHLTALKTLSINDSQVSDLSPIAGLVKIETLDLHGTSISDVTPLASLTTMKLLKLSDSKVRDLSPLRNLPNLVEISLPIATAGILVETIGVPGRLDKSGPHPIFYVGSRQ